MARLALAVVLLAAGCVTSDPPLSAGDQPKAPASRSFPGKAGPRSNPHTPRAVGALRVLRGRADRDEQRTPLAALFQRLALCESGGDWHINTGNSYYGGVQMTLDFWRSYGGLRFAARPDLASELEQITVAERGLAAQGWGAWPTCSVATGIAP